MTEISKEQLDKDIARFERWGRYLRQLNPDLAKCIKAKHPEFDDKALENPFLLSRLLLDPDLAGPNTLSLGVPGEGKSYILIPSNGEGKSNALPFEQ